MNCILLWIEIVLFVTAVIIAFFSWTIATKSLRETKKARRDSFLPIVIAKPKSSRFMGHYVSFFIQNVGHGVALRPKFHIYGIEEKGIINGYLSSSTKVGEKKALDFLDHRISQGFHYLAFDLGMDDIKKLMKYTIILGVSYEDVFQRRIETRYELVLVLEDGYFVFNLSNIRFHLP